MRYDKSFPGRKSNGVEFFPIVKHTRVVDCAMRNFTNSVPAEINDFARRIENFNIPVYSKKSTLAIINRTNGVTNTRIGYCTTIKI